MLFVTSLVCKAFGLFHALVQATVSVHVNPGVYTLCGELVHYSHVCRHQCTQLLHHFVLGIGSISVCGGGCRCGDRNFTYVTRCKGAHPSVQSAGLAQRYDALPDVRVVQDKAVGSVTVDDGFRLLLAEDAEVGPSAVDAGLHASTFILGVVHLSVVA